MSETLIFQSGHRKVYRDPEHGISVQGDAHDLCCEMAKEIESLRAQLAAVERDRDRIQAGLLAELEAVAEQQAMPDESWRERIKSLFNQGANP